MHRLRGIAVLVVFAIGAGMACNGAWAQAAKAPAQTDSTASAPAAKEALGPVTQFVKDLFDISAIDLREKFMRILVILLIGVIAKVFMDVVKTVSRFIVYSDWGPLKYAFRNHQRSITLHGLVINVLKYIVYFTALGYILNELGVKYTTFLASLSLVGIAVGFGSQGLVQDVVTGFFILFEDQFSVGDMVEISGQVGIVEEIGLRTTRLRNYFGAQVILQNRNIPMAGRYKKGAFEVGVDVAVATEEMAEKAAGLLHKIGEELEKQFREIIMACPCIVGLMELETGELFVRMRGKIWPLQQWVIDAQMVPRIREIFKREGIEIPGDRVVAFYHFPDDEKEDGAVLRKIRQIVRYTTVGYDEDESS